MSPVSYPVAWQREAGPRLVGSATVDGDGLTLVGREVGTRHAEEHLALDGGAVERVELRRSAALPSLSAVHDGRPVVIELLTGGWGAAHHLADALARPLRAPSQAASAQVRTVAIAARIRSGRRAELEEILARGVPAELDRDDVRCDEIALGDDDVVIVLTAPGTSLRALAESGLGLGGTIATPRVLTQTFSWRRGAGVRPAATG
jgi:hypothetical protein